MTEDFITALYILGTAALFIVVLNWMIKYLSSL